MSTANWVPADNGTDVLVRDGGAHLKLVDEHDDIGILPHVRIDRGVYQTVVKRGFDLAVGVVVGLLVLPVFVATAIAIRMTMGKGVFYVQERVGRGGRIFKVYKFRSMKTDRRDETRPIAFSDRRVNHKDPNDPRHTKVGRFIRKWSLDELPQVLNVIRGDMSLVGPRPEIVSIVERYPEMWMHQRHRVRPGITGAWQISQRGDKPMHECVDVDLEYVQRASFVEDFKILALTPIRALGTGH
jgi:lipopolysaccharide/colanic/teichoic acid biosynthesis glycosyltransferase